MIYYPDPATKLRHFQKPHIVEIITVFVPGLAYGDSVELELNLDEVKLSR